MFASSPPGEARSSRAVAATVASLSALPAIGLSVPGTEDSGSVPADRQPETVCRLLDDEGYVTPLVEELLRLNPIGDGGPLRISLEDVEIAGVVIPKGSAVMAAIGSANMDASWFEQPEVLTADREVNSHLAFGYGIHRCLGAALARAELRIAIRSLFK